MCGICGIATADAQQGVDATMLTRMAATLVHRGPDGEGFHQAPGIGLGFRRLAIVDLATGDQPLANEDGSVVLVCNGEIYNHVELRAALVARGHRFRSASDAEVILHLYEEHGIDALHHLRGMFAIALWDARRRRLMLARDRFGIKPLHYAFTPAGLVFASEYKAILATGTIPAAPDPQALVQLFRHGRVVGARTMAAGVRRLLPGHVLTWQEGRSGITRYWHVAFPDRREYERRSPMEWAQALRAKLEESVRLHLRSDVPVGAWLSAGIDSSAVTALAARASVVPMPTFTLRFDEASCDELARAEALDAFPSYRLDGHHILCSRQALERLPQAVWHGEDALMSGIVLGQIALAEATAKHVKVVLTGEGSDEALGGYSWYPTLRRLAPLFLLPRSARASLAGVPWVRQRWPGAAVTLAGPAAMDFDRYSRSISHLRGMDGEALLAEDVQAGAAACEDAEDLAPPPPGFADWHPFARMQYFDFSHRLADAVVLGLDRASMACSVEARVPFLDHELVELAARIPPWIKLRGGREKAVLRDAMRDVLPPPLLSRRKHAMQVPIVEWLRGDLPAFTEELLDDSALRATGCFQPARVADLRRRHRAGEPHLGQLLSGVLGVQLWHRMFGAAAGSGVLR